ncbi:hypothetical protein, partial [Flavobacterium psychrophilum]
TRTNGIINLQPQEILTLCCEKTKYFDSSAIPKSREEPSFFKTILFNLKRIFLRHQNFTTLNLTQK